MKSFLRWGPAAVLILVLTAGGYWYVTTGGSPGQPAGDKPKDGREILYWVAPMDPNYRSDKPGKSPMGMDLVPVYAANAGGTGPSLVKLTDRQLVLADVQTVPVKWASVVKRIRSTGRISYDERTVEAVTAWFPGRIESLYVDFTGDTIQKGQPMAEMYSPELITAQQEYLSTLDHPVLNRSARKKLTYWGLTDRQLARLKASGEPQSTTTIHAPRSGTIVRKVIKEGQYVREGTVLFRIADYDSLWMRVDVFQQNSLWIKEGQTVTARLPGSPEKTVTGAIEYIDPFFDEQLRATQARVSLKNPPGWVIPGMYLIANVHVPIGSIDVEGLRTDTEQRVPVVPKHAVLSTGERDVVYVQHQPGQFEPRNVSLGPLARIEHEETQVYPVVDGVRPGEEIVSRGNFLIDSQSRVGAGSGGYSGALGGDGDGGDER